MWSHLLLNRCTKQNVTGFVPAEGPRSKDTSQAKAAFKDADLIVIPAGIPRTCPTHKSEGAPAFRG